MLQLMFVLKTRARGFKVSGLESKLFQSLLQSARGSGWLTFELPGLIWGLGFRVKRLGVKCFEGLGLSPGDPQTGQTLYVTSRLPSKYPLRVLGGGGPVFFAGPLGISLLIPVFMLFYSSPLEEVVVKFQQP